MKRAKFDKMMNNVPEIRTLPAVAAQVIKIIRDENSTARDLEAIISLDPVLAARVIRMVNSAYWGLPVQVTDLQRAITLAGFTAVRNLAITASMKSLYRPEYRCSTFTAGGLWLHSVSAAVIAQMVSDRTWPELRDDAFLAGIVHDIGIIVEWSMLPDRFERAIRAHEGTSTPFAQAEKQWLGFTHSACGGTILRKWGLPKSLVLAIRNHHKAATGQKDFTAPSVSDTDRLAAVLHLTEYICAERANGFFDEQRDHDLTERLLTAVGLGWDAYRDIVDRADAELERAREVLSL